MTDEIRLTPKVTPADERPYSADALRDSIGMLGMPGTSDLLNKVTSLEKFQRRYDASEGADEKTGYSITELQNSIWGAIHFATSHRASTEIKPKRMRSEKRLPSKEDKRFKYDPEAEIRDINREL